MEVLGFSVSSLTDIFLVSMLGTSVAGLLFAILADRFGARHVLALLMVAAGAALVALTHVYGLEQFRLAAAGLALAAAASPVAAACVAAFYGPHRQGAALGILFGGALVGSYLLNPAVSLEAPAPSAYFQQAQTAMYWSLGAELWAFVIVVTALIFWGFSTVMQILKERQEGTTARPALDKSAAAELRLLTDAERSPLRCLRLWRLSLYYFYLFGGMFALPLWLPKTLLQSENSTAGPIVAGYGIFVGFWWIVGGFLSDAFGGRRILSVTVLASMAPALVLAFSASRTVAEFCGFAPETDLTPFLGVVGILVAALAIGAAAVFKLVATCYPTRVGTGAGLVGMMGGLGATLLPWAFDWLFVETARWAKLFHVAVCHGSSLSAPAGGLSRR